MIIHFGGMIAISLLIALAIFFLLKTHTLHRKKDDIELFLKQRQSLNKRIKRLNKDQIKMIRNEEIGIKISVLYLNTTSESKNFFLHTVNLVKAHRDFLRYSK